MTFLDLARLIRHYWIAVVAASLACALAAFGVSAVIVSPKYEAAATLTSTDPSGNVTADVLMSTVTPIARQVAAEATSGVSVTVEGPKSGATAAEQRVITFLAAGDNADDCVGAANAAAQETASRVAAIFLELEDNQSTKRESALEILGDVGEDDPRTEALLEAIIIDREYSHCDFIVSEATEAERKGLSASKLSLVAFLGGLVLCIAAVIVFDLIKRPIKAREDIEAHGDLSLLSWPLPAGEGEVLWANLLAKTGEFPCEVALVPLSEDGSLEIAKALCAAARNHGVGAELTINKGEGAPSALAEKPELLRVIACRPINLDASTIYCVRDAGVVIVCARLWRDGLGTLEDVLEELETAGVRPDGIALLGDKR